jgi:hypothetical protein
MVELVLLCVVLPVAVVHVADSVDMIMIGRFLDACSGMRHFAIKAVHITLDSNGGGHYCNTDVQRCLLNCTLQSVHTGL